MVVSSLSYPSDHNDKELQPGGAGIGWITPFMQERPQQ
jgi:hypothetical protein